jgi:hypothetical protein
MRMPLIKYHLLLLVRLGGYTVNLSDFYSYRLIGKLTVFFPDSGVHLPESTCELFHFRSRCSPHNWKKKSVVPSLNSLRMQLYVLTLTLTGHLSLQEHILTHHTRQHLVYWPRLYLYLFQFSEQPSVCEACRFLNFSFLVFHRTDTHT